jgi:hypothetical protein
MGIETNNCNGSICSLVCQSSNLPVLQLLVQENASWNPTALDLEETIANGDIKQLEWLKIKFPQVLLTRYLASCAAANGHLHVFIIIYKVFI